jgi:hypothetical protein
MSDEVIEDIFVLQISPVLNSMSEHRSLPRADLFAEYETSFSAFNKVIDI